MWRSSSSESISGRSHQNWVRWPNTTPMRCATCLRSRYGTRPSTSTRPPLGTRMPVSILIVVDLPAPFGPTQPTISPRSIVNETSRPPAPRARSRDDQRASSRREARPTRAPSRNVFFEPLDVRSSTLPQLARALVVPHALPPAEARQQRHDHRRQRREQSHRHRASRADRVDPARTAPARSSRTPAARRR